MLEVPQDSKLPEAHHPRGTTLREALRGNLPLGGLRGGLSQRSLRGLSEGSAGLCGGPRDFSRFFGGSDPMLVTLGLSDPRNRNHKSLAIANHIFEVASFFRRNRNEIAMLQAFRSRSEFFELRL